MMYNAVVEPRSANLRSIVTASKQGFLDTLNLGHVSSENNVSDTSSL